MNKTAMAQAVYDVLDKRVPELLKIESLIQRDKLIKAIIKGLEEAEDREKLAAEEVEREV